MNTFLGISSTLAESNLNYTALKNSAWLYVEGYLVTSDSGRDAAIKAREFAQANGVKTALSFSDPGMVQFFKPGLMAMLGNKVDLVFCNEHEALQWGDTDNLDIAMAKIQEVASTFAITLGSKGAMVFDGKKLHRISPFPVKAVDTNGAGDAFAGAFLYGITNDMDYARAGKLASLTAARVVSQFGPRLSKAGYQQVLAELGD